MSPIKLRLMVIYLCDRLGAQILNHSLAPMSFSNWSMPLRVLGGWEPLGTYVLCAFKGT